ncbi:MAG: glycosyl transferase family 1 [Acidobacteriales bacterium]|nr:glycosyl transferase family 1 [Terriglobales bacterium]
MPALLQKYQEISTRDNNVRAWTVVHACNLAREVANVVDVQLQVGMRPYLLTLNSRQEPAPHFLLEKSNTQTPASLLQGWQDVRQWRKQFDENGTNINAQLLHAHSFAAGMAAVRGDDVVVYDLDQWIEEQSSANGSWLARSFKTAEQFALARSAAVVVHSEGMRKDCITRGIASQDVFVVPDPISTAHSDQDENNPYKSEDSGLNRTVPIAVKIAQGPAAAESDAPGQTAAALSVDILFTVFSQLLLEAETARLLVITPSELLLETSKRARDLGIREKVTVVPEEDCLKAVEAAQTVIADPVAMNAGESHHRMESLAVLAMSHGKAVLAADNAMNRETSPEGRGLLWYSADKENVRREMVHRLSFMTRNADFRRALGEAGKQHLQHTRNPQRLGKLYDDVYRHAVAKANKGKRSQNASGSLIPMQAGI